MLLAIPLALSLLAADARADSRRAIVRVRSSRPALDERLSAELSTLGFPVKDVDPLEPGGDLAQVARANGASAAIRVIENEDAIEVWVDARPGAGQPVHEVFAMDPRRGWNVATVSALEVLRARLLGLHDDAAPPPRRDGLKEIPLPLPRVARRTTGLWLHFAAGAESSPGGLGLAGEILAEVRVELPSWIDLAAFGVFSPVAAQVVGPEGVAYVRHEIAGVAADARGRFGSTSASLGLGVVLGLFSMNGQARAAGYGGQDASIVTLGPVLRAGAAFAIVPALRVRGELAGGVTAPHAVIRFAGREVADWGRPFGLITLGMEWGILE